ncbi:hypothetical protein V8E54_011656 [Elaphomyces granulatus]
MSSRVSSETSDTSDTSARSRTNRESSSLAATSQASSCSHMSPDKLSSAARFGLLLLGSLFLSSLLYSPTLGIMMWDLSFVSKHLDEWWQVAGLVAWKGLELGLAWLLKFDGRDMAFFILLTHAPTFFLLFYFYRIRPTTVITSFAIDIISMTVPFMLLRRPNAVHSLSNSSSRPVSNRSILQDRPTAIYTSVAASSTFAVLLYISFSTWLPVFLVTHFDGIPDITATHAGPAGLPAMFFSLLPAGYAARDLLFLNSAGWSPEPESSGAKPSSKSNEYLVTSLYRRTWGRLGAKTRILLLRTIALASMMVLNTIVRVWGTIKGVDIVGATGWGSIWAVAALVIGLTFGWIEAVDGV